MLIVITLEPLQWRGRVESIGILHFYAKRPPGQHKRIKEMKIPTAVLRMSSNRPKN